MWACGWVAGFVGGLLDSWCGWVRGWFGGCGLLELVVVVCKNCGFGLLELLKSVCWNFGLLKSVWCLLELWVGLLKSVCWNCGLLKSVCWNWLDVSSGFAGSTNPVIGSWGCGCGGRGGLYLDRPMVCVDCDN